jgi:hypothetical protein
VECLTEQAFFGAVERDAGFVAGGFNAQHNHRASIACGGLGRAH